MSTRIALTADHFGELLTAVDAVEESAAVIAATLVPGDSAAQVPDRAHEKVTAPGARSEDPHPDRRALTLLARTVTWVPEDSYLDRTALGLSIASTGWVPALRAAIKSGAVPVFVHTHPGGNADFSSWDDLVDDALATAAHDFGAPAYASMVVAGRSDAPVLNARLCVFNPTGDATDSDPQGSEGQPAATPEFTTIDAVRVAGSALHLLLPPERADSHGDREPVAGMAVTDLVDDDIDVATRDREAALVADPFDRQVRMLGPEGQRTLGAVNAAVIGVGGTGSAVAVQLARIGVGSICLVDDDVVTAPTPTRGHGMRLADLGRPKVEALGQHLRDIGFGTHVTEVNAALHAPEALHAIQHADVVFSCVDGHGARLILNRYAYAHLAVVIDLAVLVAVPNASDGPQGAHSIRRGIEIDERVTWIGPGTACLLCRGRLDAALAYAENLAPETRKQLAGEGYVAAAETPQPAVVTLTTLVAALGATEFLLRLAGIGASEATELLLRPHIGDLRRNRIPQRPGCFCSDPTYLGRGKRETYLDLMWPTPPFEPR